MSVTFQFVCPACGSTDSFTTHENGFFNCDACGTNFMVEPGDLDELTACPACGNEDVAVFAADEERAEYDMADMAECACGWKWELLEAELKPLPEGN